MAQETELKPIHFTKSLRGYSCDEVDTYLAYVNDRFAQAARECTDLRRKMNAMTAEQNEFREEAQREQAAAKELSRKLAEEIAARKKAIDEYRAEIAVLEEKKHSLQTTLNEEARRQAAKLLAGAEAAAASLLQQAEAEAEKIRSEGKRILAEKNNLADRMVQEIDAFREKVFALYGNHIEELERLGQMTDRFYHTQASYAEEEEIVSLPPLAVLKNTDIHEDGDGQEEEYIQDSASVEDEDLWEDPSPASSAYDTDPSPSEYPEPFGTAQDLSEEEEYPPADDMYDENPFIDRTPATEDTLLTKLLDLSLEEDELTEEYLPPEKLDFTAPEKLDFAPPEKFDVPAPEVLDVPAPETRPVENDFLDDMESDAVTGETVSLSDEDLLSDLVGEYITKPGLTKPGSSPAIPADPPIQKPPRPEAKPHSPQSLDELFADGQEVSMTGEFNRIYAKDKSAAAVEQIRKQPLVAPQKPDKKHGKK